MKNIKLIPLLLSLFLFSCEDFFISEIDPPKLATETQLVVHNFLSPQDTVISVFVTLSKPIFNNTNTSDNFPVIENAIVKLTNQDNVSAIIPYNYEEEKYIIDANTFPIEAQKEYKLTVSTPDGKSVNSDCVIPKIADGKIQNINFIKKPQQYEEDNYRFSFDFVDEPGVSNYYRAVADVSYFSLYDNNLINRAINFDLFTDYNKDGQSIFVKTPEKYISTDNIVSIKITLFSVDENYYHYHRTSISQLNTEDAGPFSETTIINSNIENGLGVFCGYTFKSKTQNF